MRKATLFAVLVVCSCTSAHAEVTFDWAVVGNPGNPNDTVGDGYGGVDYTYRISKYEVTNTQYAEFLNAVAATDTYGLFDSRMGTTANGGIYQVGSSGSYTYNLIAPRQNQPVVYVSYYDAMRFVNWLQNGQPTGAEGPGTTEDGVYTISDGVSEVRNPNATVFIPSENEWYKAAYHKNDGATGNYWTYPTSTDAPPYSDQPPGSDAPDQSNTVNFYLNDNVANGYNDGFAVTGSTSVVFSQNYLTNVGAYTETTSPYGTFDQAGNVYEWNEGVIDSSYRVFRGDGYGGNLNALSSSYRGYGTPNATGNDIGFRVAAVPEPGTVVLCLLGALGLLFQLRRNR